MILEFYNLFHIIGLGLFTFAVGYWFALSQLKCYQNSPKAKKLVMIVHGIAMLFILLSGYGKTDLYAISDSFPIWLWIKVIVWLLIAIFVPFLMNRSRRYCWVLAAIIIMLFIAIFFGFFRLW